MHYFICDKTHHFKEIKEEHSSHVQKGTGVLFAFFFLLKCVIDWVLCVGMFFASMLSFLGLSHFPPALAM